MNNVIKDSQCNQIKIRLSSQELSIEDNGVGFDVSHESTGNGLKNMKMRNEALEGVSEIVSSQAKGSIIIVRF